jgi:chromosome segregation ATPase
MYVRIRDIEGKEHEMQVIDVSKDIEISENFGRYKRLEAYEDDYSEYDEKIDNLKSDIENLEYENEKLESAIEDLKSEINSIEDRISFLLCERNNLQEALRLSHGN